MKPPPLNTLRILPLVADLTNPTAAIGWENKERLSLLQRGPADTVLVLALLHHLAISNNVPFKGIAHLLASIARTLVIEFVPKSDSQVKRLLVSREDVFPGYTREGFERDFSRLFTIEEAVRIDDTDRILYLMRKR